METRPMPRGGSAFHAHACIGCSTRRSTTWRTMIPRTSRRNLSMATPMKWTRLMNTLSARRTLAACVSLLVAACSAASGTTAPDQRSDSELKLLSVPADAPPLATASVTFYAVKGKDATAEIWYRPRAGQRDSTRFLEFDLGGSTLDRRPDGTVIANGDSIRITVTVTDPTHLIVQFQPSGLTFSSKEPAHLRLSFGAVGNDLDHDGRVDTNDDDVAQKLIILRQESPG